MSYTIEPMPIITFIENSKMKLPRFQRKTTWDNKQNFELCVSVFQDYPVGVVIVNKEQNFSWLLDGRQRRYALTEMRNNPVSVYEWARTYVGFKASADIDEIKNSYWEKIERYLQKEKNDNDEHDKSDEITYDGEEDTVENSFDSDKQKRGLELLLDIILMVHQVKSKVSRWERNFDFTKFFDHLEYAPHKNNDKVNPVLLRKFILSFAKENDIEELSKDTFVEHFYDKYGIEEKNKKKFEETVDKNWNDIKNSIEIIEKSEKIFEEARIGIIQLTNVSPLDAQNIFSRINSGGTLLKAEELLSAKPFWNYSVNVTDEYTKELVKKMYKKLGVEEANSIVRWDIAATLVSRIDDQDLFFESEKSISNNIIAMDQIILGFKIISSYYVGGMSSKSVTDIERQNIKWETDIDDLINDINKLCSILLNDSFFKFFQSWKKPMVRMLGNAITLEFLIIMLKNWEDKGKPNVNNSADVHILQRDAKTLLDRLIFEYATKMWRGSGDSKMAKDIDNWKSRLIPVEKDQWLKLIKDASKGTYNGQNISYKTMAPILYYYYILTNTSPIVSADVKFDVDHIIPQEKFEDNTMIDIKNKDSLGNLALLPKKENIQKKNKTLSQITDPWLIQQIELYAGIKHCDFDKYSDITNISKLQEERKKKFIKAFDADRLSALSN